MKVVLIETKTFELSYAGSHAVRIIERGRKVTKELVLSSLTMLWVVQSLEDCVQSDGKKEFIRTFSFGGSAYIAQRSSNAYGRYLTIVEYKGGGRRSLLIFPKEVEGKGWRKMALELSELCGNVGKAGGKKYGGAEIIQQPCKIVTCSGTTSKTYTEVVSCSTPAIKGSVGRIEEYLIRVGLSY